MTRHNIPLGRILGIQIGWFEWKTVPAEAKGKPLKQPFYITRRDGLPLTFAGLWERWKLKDGLLTCTILTTEASDGTRELHGRMPMVLDKGGMDSWLRGEPPSGRRDDASPLLEGGAESRFGRHRLHSRIDALCADFFVFRPKGNESTPHRFVGSDEARRRSRRTAQIGPRQSH